MGDNGYANGFYSEHFFIYNPSTRCVTFILITLWSVYFFIILN